MIVKNHNSSAAAASSLTSSVIPYLVASPLLQLSMNSVMSSAVNSDGFLTKTNLLLIFPSIKTTPCFDGLILM